MWIIGLLILGIILFLIFARPKFRVPGLSPLSLFLAILIFIAAVILFNVIWADLSELVRPEGVSKYYRGDGYFSYKLSELLVHVLYVIPLLIIAVIIYVTVGRKGPKYRVVTFPYFAASAIMAIRLIIDTGYIAIQRFEKAGVYGVLIFILVALTFLIFYIQRKWEEHKKEEVKQ